MAAHSCYDDDAARAAARARRRVVKLRQRRSSTPWKARKLLRQKASGKRQGARRSPLMTLLRTKRVAAIRRKMESLRRLVAPAAVRGGGAGSGGERLDELLLHAAGYIVRLQMQVRVMQGMVHALNNPED